MPSDLAPPNPTPLWAAPFTESAIRGIVRVPGSKSITNRALIIAALSDEVSLIKNALSARDTALMIDGLRILGVGIDALEPGILRITPHPLTGDCEIDCGLSGTVMRFLPPLAALATGRVRFSGDEQALLRPTAPTIEALRQLGVGVAQDGPASLPFTVQATGGVFGREVTIDASGSSQFVSGLLLSGARFANGVRVVHRGPAIPSLPHIDMTVKLLEFAGASTDANMTDPLDAAWSVEPGHLHLGELTIEPDLSNATPFLAAAMVTAGTVSVLDWPEVTTQAGDAIREIFAEMGATFTRDGTALTIEGPDVLRGCDFEMGHAGELVPTVAAVCCFADRPSRLTGIAHLRGHETDRLQALVTEINRIGGHAIEVPDGIEIRPIAHPVASEIRTYHDHRMATFGAIVGLRVPGTQVTDVQTTNKTLPDFVQLWTELVGADG